MNTVLIRVNYALLMQQPKIITLKPNYSIIFTAKISYLKTKILNTYYNKTELIPMQATTKKSERVLILDHFTVKIKT
jgi:hypothetical protein